MTDPRSTPWTRRRFSSLATGGAASVLAIVLSADSEAKRKRKRKNKNKNKQQDQCLGLDQACITDVLGSGGCCPGTRCDCGQTVCIVGLSGTCLPLVDPN